jgi:hypothetical protein
MKKLLSVFALAGIVGASVNVVSCENKPESIAKTTTFVAFNNFSFTMEKDKIYQFNLYEGMDGGIEARVVMHYEGVEYDIDYLNQDSFYNVKKFESLEDYIKGDKYLEFFDLGKVMIHTYN